MVRQKVLIVDDDKERMTAVRCHLEKDGFEPSSFIRAETPIILLSAETMDEERLNG